MPARREFPEPKAAFWGTLCTIAGWRCAQYDGIVAAADCEHFGRSRGGRFNGGWYVGCRNRPCFGGPAGDRLRSSGQGIQFRQYADSRRRHGRLHRCDHDRARGSAIRELKTIARRLGAGMPEPRGEITVRPVLPPGAVRDLAPEAGRRKRGRHRGRRHGRTRPLRTIVRPNRNRPSAPQASKPKRNLLFSSTSRKERERAQSRTSEPLPPDMLSADLRPNPADVPPPVEPSEPPPASFDDAWPKPERGRQGDIPPQRRSPRPPPARRGQWRFGTEWRSAGSHGAEIGRRRRHGLFALFGRFDRGPDAGGHDALRLDRRIARASRPAAVSRQYLVAGPY